MKLKWRQHELILATILYVLAIASFLWNRIGLSAGEISNTYAVHFLSRNLPFDFDRNILLPQIASVLVLFLGYLWINLVTFRPVRRPHGVVAALPVRIILVVVQLLALSFLMALAANAATYLARPHLINYGPGFRFLALFGYNEHPLTNLLAGFDMGIALVAIYTGYAAIREGVSRLIEKAGRRQAYRVLIANQITALAVVYLSFALLLEVFDASGYYFRLFYYLVIPPVVIVYLSHTYWLFPKGESPVIRTGNFWRIRLNFRMIYRLLLSTFLFTFPFAFLLSQAVAFHHGGGAFYGWFFGVFFLFWAVQMLVVTPLSWLFYEQRKDTIVQLRGVEKKFRKSESDLRFLRSQINPHFLFNTLNTLYGTALLEKSGRTAEGIQKLGDMMRFMLHENSLDVIPMSREIEYLNNYIALQKLRTQASPGVRIEKQIEDEPCDRQIAPMLLIPFVENAFKHGISLKNESWVSIRLDCDEQQIRFEVRNSLHTRPENDAEKGKSGVGLKNVVERLSLLYEGRHQLTCGREGNEFVVRLSIQP